MSKPCSRCAGIGDIRNENMRDPRYDEMEECPDCEGSGVAAKSDESDTEQRDTEVWKSYVWHRGQCFFISTIWRDYETFAGTMSGHETLVWRYDWKTHQRGDLIHQDGGGLNTHQEICRTLIATGKLPEDRDEYRPVWYL